MTLLIKQVAVALLAKLIKDASSKDIAFHFIVEVAVH